MSDLSAPLKAALAGRYAVQRELGHGGMATIYLAEDLKHHRPVAIKVLDPGVAAAIGSERFLREIESAARLTHPHILPLHDSGQAGGLLYYVMPFVEGESLRQRLEREKQLPLGDALRIAREVADALDYAHRRGVVHRDIKPENILLAEQHAVVADFGIARAIVAAGGEKLTPTGAVIGTPAYMSPEQAVGSRELDGRSDLYSLACVVYELLAGEPPFTGPTGESLAHQHLNVAPRPVRALRTAVPEAVDQALAKALAKPAADRFATAAEFGAALDHALAMAPGAGEETQGARPGAKRATHRARWVAGGVATVLVAIGTFAMVRNPDWQSRWLGGTSAAHPAKKAWILVAEFEGPPEDSSLAVTTRDLVSAALDQSEIVATVPRDQIRLALQMAGKPASTRVDAEVAKELAYRSAVRVVLEGKIGRLAQGYSVVLRVVDAESLKVVLTESAVAKNEDALIPTLGQLAQKLRAGLGEKRGAIQATRPLAAVSTPSFEAYRLYAQGYRMIASLAPREAIPVLRDALALDPDFANAWRYLGVSFNNLGQSDSGLAALDEALRRPQRLTTTQRLNTEGVRAETGRGALAAYQRVLQYDPADIAALTNGALALGSLGRFEEALEWARRAERASPFGANQVMRANEVLYLSSLGRADEAREVTRYLKGPEGPLNRTYVEIAASNWAAAESVAVALLDDPGLTEDEAPWAIQAAASAQAARGALRAATATYERAEQVAHGAAAPVFYQDRARRARLMLAIVSGGAIPLPADAWAHDSATATLITRGLRAAITGDRAGAQRLLNVVRARSPRELAWQGAAPALLGARIEALAGRWAEAARLLQPIASQSVEMGYVDYPAGMSAIRWFLADAFEKLGQPDSAAVYLERAVSAPASAFDLDSHLYGIAWPFAHRRLVLLYARMGRIEDAKRHWQIFAETVRTPDPEIQPLIAEARAALTSAEAMAKSARQ